MLNRIKNLVSEEKGQGMTEYGLLLAVVVIVIVIVLAAFKTQLTNLFNTVVTNLEQAVSDATS